MTSAKSGPKEGSPPNAPAFAPAPCEGFRLDVGFDIDHPFTALFGAAGSSKTSILNMIAGFVARSSERSNWEIVSCSTPLAECRRLSAFRRPHWGGAVGPGPDTAVAVALGPTPSFAHRKTRSGPGCLCRVCRQNGPGTFLDSSTLAARLPTRGVLAVVIAGTPSARQLAKWDESVLCRPRTGLGLMERLQEN
jgi:hypothetical protein